MRRAGLFTKIVLLKTAFPVSVICQPKTTSRLAHSRCACCTTTSSNIAKGLHKIEKFINFMPMQGKKNYQEKLFTSFKLSDRVSKENFYRRLKEVLNLDF